MDYFTINYHSNYADYVRTPAEKIQKLNSREDIIVYSKDYYYDKDYLDSLYNYSGHSHENNLIMLRHGYLPTRYWNTKKDGSGIRYFEGEGTDYPVSGLDIALAFGLNPYEKATIDVYPEWIPQKKVWFAKGRFWASNYFEDAERIEMDPNGNIHCFMCSDITGSTNLYNYFLNTLSKEYGSPYFPAASALVKAYNEYGDNFQVTDDELAEFTIY